MKKISEKNNNNFYNNTEINRNKVYQNNHKNRYTNFVENIIPELPNKIIDDDSLKYLLRFHGGANNENRDFEIPPNFYIISLEKSGLLYTSLILDYLFLRMGILNSISNTFFQNITEEILFIESQKMKYLRPNINLNNIEEKRFKIYKPGDRFHDYNISTEEHNKFFSGLSKFPLKPYLIDKKNQKNRLSYEDILSNIIENKDISSIKCVINPYDIDCENSILLHKNDYYTLHCNHKLEEYKILKYKNIKNNHGKYTKCLRHFLPLSKKKNVTLYNIIQFLHNKHKSEKEPIILILDICTIKNDYEYYQNYYLKNNYNNNPTFYYNNNPTFYYNNLIFNNNYTNNYNYYSDCNGYRYPNTMKKIFEKINDFNLNNNTIDLFTKKLFQKIIENKSKIRENTYYTNINENNNFSKILSVFNEYYDIIEDYPYCSTSGFFIFLNNYENREISKILRCFTDNVFKYYLLLFLIKSKKYDKLKIFIEDYPDNFNNMEFYINLFRSLEINQSLIYLNNENMNNEDIYRIKLFNNSNNEIYSLDIIRLLCKFMIEYNEFYMKAKDSPSNK
jgi:hypothetical protein